MLLALTLLAGTVLAVQLWRRSHPPLLTAGAGLTATGDLTPVSSADQLLPGTRVLTGPGGESLAAEQRRWLRASRVPSPPELGQTDLVSTALLDLHTLGHPYGVAVASSSPSWHYVWPRDSAFVASALARTGHRIDAERILAFLQRVQRPNGEFDARYRPDGSTPDAREVQLDGSGWSLWALAEVARTATPAERRGLIDRHRSLLDASTAAAIRLTGGGQHLPSASPDYWELPATAPTLATCATLLAGLRSAGWLYEVIGAGGAEKAQAAADRLASTILAEFAADGFPRTPGGSPDSVDLGVTLLMAPFGTVDSSDVVAAWRRSPQYLRRPAGGLAPGGSWRRDGISWTPTVATYAVAAACVDRELAVPWLRWLAAHRTPVGALPEKVRADGSPASVAPLAWTAAAVVIAADELERGCPADTS